MPNEVRNSKFWSLKKTKKKKDNKKVLDLFYSADIIGDYTNI